jgi:hypothetical protein
MERSQGFADFGGSLQVGRRRQVVKTSCLHMAWGGGDSPSREKAAGRERFKRSRREASSRQNSPTTAKTTVLGLLKAAEGATKTPKIPLPKAEEVKAIKLGWRNETSQEGNLTLAQGGFST